jgi:Outer membrane protein beta-barrel domain
MLSEFGKWRSDDRCAEAGAGAGAGARAGAIRAVAILALAAGLASLAHAQTTSPGDQGGLGIFAGATGTGTYAQYGERKMLGVTGFVDADGRRRLGIEAEGQWVEFHQSADVHIETYSIGVRYHFVEGRFQPYVKGLVGFGDFNFPYNLATGRFLAVTGGGGLDIRLSRRIYIRAVDFEYQSWPQFTFGAMTTLNASAGLRVRVF